MMVGESCDIFAVQVLVVQTFAVCVKIQALTHLFVKVLHAYLNQETAKELFWSLSQAATCYYHSNQ